MGEVFLSTQTHRTLFSFPFRSQLDIKTYVDESLSPHCDEVDAIETNNCKTTVEEDQNLMLFTNDTIVYDTMVNEADQDLQEKNLIYILKIMMNHEYEVSDECETDDILQFNLDLDEQH